MKKKIKEEHIKHVFILVLITFTITLSSTFLSKNVDFTLLDNIMWVGHAFLNSC